jgi:methane/ammonia monooxygenase subunit B
VRALARLGVVLGAAALVLVPADAALAHGERTQPSWARTATSTFFDVQYSGARFTGTGDEKEYVVGVGDTLQVSGKVHISEYFPAAMGGFDMGAIGFLMQGPVLALRDLKVNGVFVPGSLVMGRGDTFSFEATLVGRRPGRFHVHPRIDIKGKGPTVGDGTWVRVRDNGEDYERPITLASGERIDLERFGLGRVYQYHLLWIALAAAFCTGLLWRKRLLSRLLAVREGVPDQELVTSRDRRLTGVVGIVTVVLIIGGFLYARNEWTTIPLQVRREAVPKLEPPELATARLAEARYDEDRGSLTLRLELENRSTTSAVQVERLVVGPVSLAPSQFRVAGEDEPLRLADDAPLQPGERRTVTLTAATGALEEHRLLFANSALAQLGGLLIVRDAEGERSWVALLADLIRDPAAEVS